MDDGSAMGEHGENGQPSLQAKAMAGTCTCIYTCASVVHYTRHSVSNAKSAGFSTAGVESLTVASQVI